MLMTSNGTMFEGQVHEHTKEEIQANTRYNRERERERERDELGKLKLSTSPTVAGVVGVVGAECGACEITNYHACRSDELLQPHS